LTGKEFNLEIINLTADLNLFILLTRVKLFEVKASSSDIIDGIKGKQEKTTTNKIH
jgi:hypothetical protein